MNGKNMLFVGIGLGISIIGMLFLYYGYENTWKLWGIPTMYPYFADLRTITGGAESWALGYDPLVNNPGDPWGRLMNYPRVWQMLFRAGIDQTDTVYFGVAFFLLSLPEFSCTCLATLTMFLPPSCCVPYFHPPYC